MLLEKDLEDIISKYPDLIEEGLTLKERQLTFYGRRMDLLFEDKFKRRLILELKNGPIKDQHIGQIMSYEGMLLSGDDPTVRIMLVGTRVPPNIQKSLDHHGIAWKELTYSYLKKFLAEKEDDLFLNLFDEGEYYSTTKIKETHHQFESMTPDQIIAKLKFSENYNNFKGVLKQKIDHEDQAKSILIQNLGNLTYDHIKKIIDLIDKPYQYYHNGKLTHGPWFGRLLQSNTGKLSTVDPFKLNGWFNLVSNCHIPAEKKIDLLLNEPYCIPGLNVGFITLMFYLLDKDSYSVWFEGLHDGLRIISPDIEPFKPKSKQYLIFNEASKNFASKYFFESTELDWIFSTGLPGIYGSKKTGQPQIEKSDVTDLRQFQLEYWTGLNTYMKSMGSFVKMRTPSSKQWSDVSLGNSDIYLAVGINSQKSNLNIWLIIRGQKGKNNFDNLYKSAFEDSLIEISSDIQWDRMDSNKSCAVKLTQVANFGERNDWENQFEWLKEYIEKYVKFFKPRIKNI
jgi:hypothetical protein